MFFCVVEISRLQANLRKQQNYFAFKNFPIYTVVAIVYRICFLLDFKPFQVTFLEVRTCFAWCGKELSGLEEGLR